jgi:hypothetical protein
MTARPVESAAIFCPRYNQRAAPDVKGTVSRIAGDLIREQQTDLAYYTAGIRVEPCLYQG